MHCALCSVFIAEESECWLAFIMGGRPLSWGKPPAMRREGRMLGTSWGAGGRGNPLRLCPFASPHSLARVAMTKCHRWGGFNHRHLLPHSIGSCKSKIKVSSGLGSPQGSLLGHLLAVSSHGLSSACVPLVSPLVSTFPLIRTHPYGAKLGSTLTTSFNLPL